MGFPTDLPELKTDYDSGDLAVTSAEKNEAYAEVNAIATKVGVDGSAVTTSHDYKLSLVTSTSKALPNSYLDTDGALTANSDSKVATQKAAKTYVDTHALDTSTHGVAQIAGIADIPVKATATEISSGTDDAKFATALAIRNATHTLTSPTLGGTPVLDATSAIPFYGDNMSRQAIINGNFDVWQRGTSFTGADLTRTWCADHWSTYYNKDGGTLPTITITRDTITPGDLSNSWYSYKCTVDGAGSSFGNDALGHLAYNRIEYGTRLLAGANKKITVSFYAKSDIANKRLGFYMDQDYGLGGSPSTRETLTGEIITLTSSWTKYTKTFTTNTLSGKTFGTDNDDFLQIVFTAMWGTTTATNRFGGGTAESFVGAGSIWIAQVQLCAGDVALPFQPKSFEEELRACQRYYEKSYAYATALGTSTEVNCFMQIDPIAAGYFPIQFQVVKAKAATMVFYSTTGASGKYRDISSGADFDITGGTSFGDRGGRVELANHGAADELIGFHWTASAEL
jgi:hypothetical protein